MKTLITFHNYALFSALLSSAVAERALSQTTQNQTIPLQSGWNLIAFQVTPTNPSPAVVFGALGGNFKAAFTYDAATKRWTSFQNPSTPGLDPAANTLPGVGMGNVELGRGYWIWVNTATPSSPTDPTAWKIAGTVPTITPALSTSTGWNLIGVPAGTADQSVTSRIGLLSVLTRAGFNYDQLLKWEAPVSAFRKAAVAKSDGTAAVGDPEMRFFDANAGYWVNVTDPAVLQPTVNITLRPDYNLESY